MRVVPTAKTETRSRDREIEVAKRLHASAGILPGEWLPREFRRQPMRISRVWYIEDQGTGK